MYVTRKKGNCWPLPYIFGSRHLAGKIILKTIINTATYIPDNTADTTKDQLIFEK